MLPGWQAGNDWLAQVATIHDASFLFVTVIVRGLIRFSLEINREIRLAPIDSRSLEPPPIIIVYRNNQSKVPTSGM